MLELIRLFSSSFIEMMGTIRWLPLSLLFLEQAMRRGSLPSFLSFSLLLTISFFEGYPQIALANTLFCLAYAIVFQFLSKEFLLGATLSFLTLLTLLAALLSLPFSPKIPLRS